MIAQKKAEKKKAKEKSKKRAKTPEFNPAQEDDMDRAAQQLAMKMAAGRADLGDWKPPSERDTPAVPTEEQPEKPARQTEQIPQSNAIEEQRTESAEVPSASEQNVDTSQRPIEDAAQQPEHSGWAGFGDENLFTQSYDPFDVRSAEDLVEAAKERAAAEVAAAQAQEDVDFFGGGIGGDRRSVASSPTPEGGSPASSRPTGFEDEFRVDVSSLIVVQ
ncbi:unnamed protein product [Anisakis simplex]|uniref:Signal recognition particle-docking protein FtsY n=1 Tax=Anisakis simplex TaxID=6269 RepID=A0A0M3KG68_ANISI|nr:unnamed protein product [Anisakis simplex]